MSLMSLRCGRFLFHRSNLNTMVIGHRRTLITATEQASTLPRLPVPPMKKTLDKFLRTVKPLVTEEEYLQTEKVVSNFGAVGGTGEKLQALLEEKAEKSENWLSEWWLNAAYLEFRLPVVMWSSPGLVGPLQTFKSLDDQLLFAAKMIVGALGYKKLIDDNAIPLEKSGGIPLDMSQYFKIFSTCRIPGKGRDSLEFFSQDAHPPTHIVVARNNHFFRVEVYDKAMRALPVNAVMQQLRAVVNMSAKPETPIGILSSDNRDVWEKAFKELIKNKVNRPAVDALQRSIFLLCLDAPNAETSALNKQTVAALQMIHGGGSKYNGGNRWFDKTIQFVVGTSGEVGLTYEHSPAEGVAIANLLDHIFDQIEHNKISIDADPSIIVPAPEKLQFEVNENIAKAIGESGSSLDKLVEELEMSCFSFTNFGKDFIKSQKMSPDGFIQMAIQLAFYRTHNQVGACYESGATRQFLHGRTETIRSTSCESRAFCEAMLNPIASDSSKIEALKNALSAHKKYAAEAMQGFGVDRHFLGMKLMALEKGIKVPEIYSDAGYSRSSSFRISTSQVPVRCDGFMCYGPLVEDGYGCCYNPRTSSINFGISALKACRETSPLGFRNALAQSLIDMHNLVLRGQKSKL